MEWCIVIAILFACGAYVVLRAARTWRRLNSTENPGCGDDCPGCAGQGACRRGCHPGKPPGAGSEPDGRRGAVQLALEATLGAFTTLNERHQLLLEVDGAYRPAPGPSELRLQLGGAAVGYNLVLSESIELINQVFIDLPQSASEPIAVGVMLGFVATLAAS